MSRHAATFGSGTLASSGVASAAGAGRGSRFSAAIHFLENGV